MSVKTNDLKKGVRVRLRNGWWAEVADNARGDRRMCKVFGDFTEIGSVYSHDIVLAEIDGFTHMVEHTPSQVKLHAMVQAAWDEI